MRQYKSSVFFLAIGTILLILCSCNKNLDNYKSPNATIYGAILDSKTNDTLFFANDLGQCGYLFLYQTNYGSSSISTSITSDYGYNGVYQNAGLFDGTYQIVPTGAFYYTDTITQSINGKTKIDLKVSQWIYVTLQIGIVTNNSITVTYTAVSNDSANQVMARVAAMLFNTPYPDINHYISSGGISGRILHSVGSSQNIYTFTDTFTGLASGTTYYIRAGSRTATSTINPNSYYNYSSVVAVTTQ